MILLYNHRQISRTVIYDPTAQSPALPVESHKPVFQIPNIPANLSPAGTVLAPPVESGHPSLTVSSNIHSEMQVHALNKAIINIGRDADNDIVIADRTISGKHAQIVQEGDALFFVHPHPARAKTTNGLWYQGQKILRQSAVSQTAYKWRYFPHWGRTWNAGYAHLR